MNVGELKRLLNGWKDDAPVVIEDCTMMEVHELRTVRHELMVEWIEQQKKDVCLLSINEVKQPIPTL